MLELHLKSLESLLLSDSDVGLFQRNWPETVVEVEQPFGWVDTQEGSHILTQGGVGGAKGGRERDEESEGGRGREMVCERVYNYSICIYLIVG